MKKFILMMAAVALLASCNKKGEGTTPTEDSLSLAYGTMAGYGIKMQVQNTPDSVNFEEFVKGFEKAVAAEADTSVNARSFAMGEQFGSQLVNSFVALKEQGVNINKELFLAELKKAFADKKEPDQAKMMNLQMTLQSLMGKVQAAAAKKKAEEGVKYYQEAEKSGQYQKTAQGVLYKVEKEGKGANFKRGDVVMVKYKGMHTDGSVFDQSPKAVEFPVDEAQLIKGFVEMLTNMKPGMKVTCIIPGKLAYGERGNQNIAPNETLVFEIETGNLAPAAPKAPAAPAEAVMVDSVK
ncbi:MAG: FKBP-type peptidyl-prolyl cis-trans isomerase [Bacteroidales bacterium]|nr:FKBP-type peptidyl-prolyl cis-trans isomerase [Bacteroidales bacterium]